MTTERTAGPAYGEREREVNAYVYICVGGADGNEGPTP